MSHESLEERIEKIEKRNKAVEADKAWETSWSRRMAVVFLTYLFIGIYMTSIGVDKPWLNAIIPVLGFLFSVFSISGLKKIWVKYCYKK